MSLPHGGCASQVYMDPLRRWDGIAPSFIQVAAWLDFKGRARHSIPTKPPSKQTWHRQKKAGFTLDRFTKKKPSTSGAIWLFPYQASRSGNGATTRP